MNCKNCGTVLNATDKFCLSCGTPVDMPAPVAPVTPLVAPATMTSGQMPEQPMVQPVQQVPVVPEQPMVQPVVQPMPVQPVEQQPVEKGIEEYATTGLPVGQPMPEPVETTIPVGPSLSATEQAQPTPTVVEVPAVTPTPVIPGAPIAPMNGNVQPEQPAPKNDNKKLFIIIGGILLVTVVAVVVLVLVLGKDKEEAKDTDKKDNETSNKETEKEPTIEEPKVETYQLTLGKFLFNIPTEYISSLEDGYIALESDDYYFEIKPFDGYTISATTNDDITEYLTGLSVTVIGVEEKTVNGKAYVVANGYYNGVECAFVFTKSTTLYYLFGYGAKQDFSYDEEVAEELISIIEDVEYSSTTNMNTSTGFGKFAPIK